MALKTELSVGQQFQVNRSELVTKKFDLPYNSILEISKIDDGRVEVTVVKAEPWGEVLKEHRSEPPAEGTTASWSEGYFRKEVLQKLRTRVNV